MHKVHKKGIYFNDTISRKTNKKVKAVKRMSARSGKYAAPFDAYGYQKSDVNKQAALRQNIKHLKSLVAEEKSIR